MATLTESIRNSLDILSEESPMEDTLWWDLSDEQRAQYEEEYVQDLMQETGSSREMAEMNFEQWLNADGWMTRDARIEARREREQERTQEPEDDGDWEARAEAEAERYLDHSFYENDYKQ